MIPPRLLWTLTSGLQGPRHQGASATGNGRSNSPLLPSENPRVGEEWTRDVAKHVRAFAWLKQQWHDGQAALDRERLVGILLCEPPHLHFTHPARRDLLSPWPPTPTMSIIRSLYRVPPCHGAGPASD